MKNASEPSGYAILIVGAGGMLGTALARVAPGRGYTPHAYTKAQLDITDRDATRDVIADFAAEAARTGTRCAVVNAAAYTDVERAEDDAERAFLINETAAGWLAEGAWEHGLALVHVSTDFVFDGTKGEPYLETDEPHPLCVYGASKLAGEKAVLLGHPDALVVRTAWTYGLGGTNFPLKVLRRALELAPGVPLGVVSDEIGAPTYSVDLAESLLSLLSAGATGMYHLTGTGVCSRYELALETLRLSGRFAPGQLVVEPVASEDFPTKATRPLRCILDCGKAARLGVSLPPWQHGLARFLDETQEKA